MSHPRSFAALGFALAWALPVMAMPARAADPPAVIGQPPQSDSRDLSDVPGEQAMLVRIWMPGLDLNFIPQGVTVIGRHVLVAAYRSEQIETTGENCRVFRVNMDTGQVEGGFALPKSCYHPGGMANDQQGTLFVADTSTLYVIDVARALADGHISQALVKELNFGGALRGSFAAYRAGDIWIGVYHGRESRRLYRFPVEGIMAKKPGTLLTEADATGNIPVSARSQGVAFDAKGGLWLTQSGRHGGTVQKVNTRSGMVKFSCDMPPGIEDLAFDADGRLWTVSEAGAGRHRSWPTYYPLVFALDPARLKSC